MKIITGHKGQGHVTSEHDASWHRALLGEGSYILGTGSSLRADVISANEIRIRDGVLSHQGYFGIVEIGTYDSLAIANGAQGVKRKDLIVCRYTKAGKIENMELVVIQGTPSASNPATPSYNTGSIASGNSPVEFPLYVVNISGISVTGVERLADVVSINGKFNDINTRIDSAEASVSAIRSDMGEVKMKAVIREGINIPAGGNGRISETVIDFSDVIPSGVHLVGVDVTLGDFYLPYVRDGNPATWVAKLWERAVRIDNNIASPWNNYTMYATLFYTEVTP